MFIDTHLVRVCLVVPCYNEVQRFPIREFEDYYSTNANVYYCFVNDGSKDNTLELLHDLGKGREDRINILDLRQNEGKAEAVRRGMLTANEWNKFDYIGFFDADLSTPLSQLNLFLECCSDYKPEIIVGSRIKRMGAIIERKSYRHYLGRIFATFASIILKLPFYDTQCGAKLFKAHLIPIVFEKSFLSKWFFDIEIFARLLSKLGYTYVFDSLIEVPLLRWDEKGNSKLRIIDFIKVPFELLKIYFYYRKGIKTEFVIYKKEKR